MEGRGDMWEGDGRASGVDGSFRLLDGLDLVDLLFQIHLMQPDCSSNAYLSKLHDVVRQGTCFVREDVSHLAEVFQNSVGVAPSRKNDNKGGKRDNDLVDDPFEGGLLCFGMLVGVHANLAILSSVDDKTNCGAGVSNDASTIDNFA
ncbi:hypothetical protein HG531_002185 [Fusarium graminearum]|nr:hypothetical protein HG531_002185 [Fusarium graminearum]